MWIMFAFSKSNDRSVYIYDRMFRRHLICDLGTEHPTQELDSDYYYSTMSNLFMNDIVYIIIY